MYNYVHILRDKSNFFKKFNIKLAQLLIWPFFWTNFGPINLLYLRVDNDLGGIDQKSFIAHYLCRDFENNVKMGINLGKFHLKRMTILTLFLQLSET